MPPPRKSPMARRREVLIPLAMLLVAIGLRLWQLGAKSLWLDEATSWVFGRMSLAHILTNGQETNPPLYYAILHGWMAVFGSSEVSLRVPSVVCGVLAVALIGWVGALIGGRRVAYVAMGLMALMPMPVEYSQMARTYTLFLAASLASWGCLLSWESSRRSRWVAGYVVATVVMAYAHYYWVFVFAAQQAYMGWGVLTRRVPLGAWLGLSAAVMAAYLPWLVIAVTQTVHSQAAGLFVARPGAADLVEAISTQVAFHGAPVYVGFSLLLAAFGLLAGTIGKTASASDRPVLAQSVRATTGVLLLWWVCLVVLPFLVSRVGPAIFRARYAIAAIPALYLLIARGILIIPARILRAVAVAVLLCGSMIGLNQYYASEHEDWRALTADVEQRVRPSDTIIVASTRPDPFAYYYRGRIPFAVPFDVLPPSRDTNRSAMMQLRQRIQQLAQGHGRVWVVCRLAFHRDYKPVIMEAILDQQPNAQLIYQREFPHDLAIYGFELAPAQGVHG